LDSFPFYQALNSASVKYKKHDVVFYLLRSGYVPLDFDLFSVSLFRFSLDAGDRSADESSSWKNKRPA